MSKVSRVHIDLAISALFRPGDVVELRIPKAGRFKTISGYFDDFAKLGDAIEERSGNFEGIYYTLNPVNSALLARANNNAKEYAQATTNDRDVFRRRRSSRRCGSGPARCRRADPGLTLGWPWGKVLLPPHLTCPF